MLTREEVLRKRPSCVDVEQSSRELLLVDGREKRLSCLGVKKGAEL